MTDDASSILVHGTCLSFGGQGILLRGEPGTGKSDLALRLLFQAMPTLNPNPLLVADDQVILKRVRDRIVAACPDALAGLLEVRGIGLVTVPHAKEAVVALLTDLVPSTEVPRFPDELSCEEILGLQIRRIWLDPYEASAPLKVALALRKFTGDAVD